MHLIPKTVTSTLGCLYFHQPGKSKFQRKEAVFSMTNLGIEKRVLAETFDLLALAK